MGLLGVFMTAATVLGCVSPVSALPDFSKWAPPGEGDVRSPCPALNSLANHGILPHSGKGMTIPILSKGLAEGMNVAADFSVLAGALGAMSARNPLGLSFNLDELDKHEQMIEHDGSLSRGDVYFGDNHSFNETIWRDVLAHFQGSDTASIEAAAKARWHRLMTAKARDPTFTYNAKDVVLSYVETSLYLLVLGDGLTKQPPVDWVRILFEQERLPYNEGWRPAQTPTSMATLVAMTGLLNVASGETLPEGLELTEGILQKVLSGDPLEGLVGNLPDIPGLPHIG